jgi:Zn-dependent protease with chaperone function
MSSPTPSTPEPASQKSAPQKSAQAVQQGFAALQQKDYAGAIAHLEALSLDSQDPWVAKAQMGLVVAYGKLGQAQKAATLCRALCEHADPQVRHWAEQTQRRFSPLAGTSPPPVAAAPDRTGFAPLEAAPPRSAPQLPPPSPAGPEGRSPRSGPLPVFNPAPAVLPGGKSAITPAAVPSVPPPSAPPLSAPPSSAPPPAAYRPQWRQAGRLNRGKFLGKVAWWRLGFVQIGTGVALFWLVQQLLFQPPRWYWQLAMKLPLLHVSYVASPPPVMAILVGLGLLAGGSRWLLDGLLMRVYGLRGLTLGQLAQVSPEAGRSLPRFCSQRRIPIPDLGILPVPEPMVFSYGVVPWVTRIVVSQGLLDRLADDEIAALYAQEVGQIATGTVPLLSLIAVVAHIPYTLYWLGAEWGRRQSVPFLRLVATGGTALSYGAYALIRWGGLWAARSRTYYGDRVATELTGNPNGHTRALLKLAIAMAETVQQQRKTSYLLEGFDLLLPLGLHQGITLGSLYPYMPLEPILEWDRTSPYRSWLSLNQTHPPLGDRLYLLDLYARHWQLDSELDFGSDIAGINRRRKAALTRPEWQTLWLQAAPFVGLAAGGAIAMGLLVLGTVGFWARVDALSWMMGDLTLVRSLPLIGFSLGTFLRINAFFPDIVPQVNTVPPAIVALMGDNRLPVHSQPIQIQGKLLGRPAIGNTLSQDLWLQTETGLVRLHSLSRWGPVGNLLPQATAATALLHQDVVVTGWGRRGAIPWIDIETVRSPLGRTHTSHHPIWSTILATGMALWGIFALIQGSRF